MGTVLALCGSLANACMCLCSDKECLKEHGQGSCKKNRDYDRVIDASTVETLAYDVVIQMEKRDSLGLKLRIVKNCIAIFYPKSLAQQRRHLSSLISMEMES